jgi:putative tricarboxylic transport membrane protein
VSGRRPIRFLLLTCALCGANAVGLRSQPVDHLVLVAPAAPGGGWDQTARAFQQVIEKEGLAGVVEVQNVPGAAGTIGLSQFVSAGPREARSLLITGLVMLGATLWNDSPVSVSQATPIARLTGEYEVIAVPASSPIRDLQALVDAFRRKPEAFVWGGGSAGGSDHILAGLVAEAAGVDPRRVNYVAFSGGGEAVAALLGGHVTAGVSGYSEFAAHLASGRLRAVAISSPLPVPGIGVPTLRDSGLAVEMVNWRGVLGAAGLSGEQRARLTELVRRAAHTDGWRRILAEREWTDLYLDGPAFDAYLASERTRLGRVVARLRGPGRNAPIVAGERLVPIVVLGGAASVFVALFAVRRGLRPRRPTGSHGQPAAAEHRSAVAGVALGLAAFLILLQPLGFVVAATALFAIVAARLEPTPLRRTRLIGTLVLAAAFALLVDLAFTRGLDLSLPRPPWSSWTR